MEDRKHPNPFWDDDTAADLKRQFGAMLCQMPTNPFEAARRVMPGAAFNGRANYIGQHWVDDPLVIEAMESRVATMGAAAGIPTKEEFALSLLNEPVTDKDLKLKYMRTFAEVMGYIEKGGGVNINNTNNILNAPKVMVLPPKRSLDQWTLEATENSKKIQAL